jgi:16S rRNA G1207 methylase RsmC
MMGILNNSDQKIRPVNKLAALEGVYDYVLIQIPKNMSFFEDILCHLTQHLHFKSKMICGSMVKHLAPASFDLLNKYIGKTSTSLAQKKARVIFADFEKAKVQSTYPLSVKIESFEIPFTHHSNLFSRDKLDMGTRFFLEYIPRGHFKSILDLGCANGIIGIKAKMMNPDTKIHFSDDSSMAIESAQTNYKNYFKDEASFFWTNCFENQPKKSLDLVLCNPPFHQGNTIGNFIASQMFQDAYDALKDGGMIRVIGNSHLGHQKNLKRIFGNSTIVATNSKFIICDAKK